MTQRHQNLKKLILAWFALDTILVLFPPIYLFMSGQSTPILGVPLIVAYFLLTALCIASSIVGAYFVDCETGEI